MDILGFVYGNLWTDKEEQNKKLAGNKDEIPEKFKMLIKDIEVLSISDKKELFKLLKKEFDVSVSD